jgi:hypothetical protein
MRLHQQAVLEWVTAELEAAAAEKDYWQHCSLPGILLSRVEELRAQLRSAELSGVLHAARAKAEAAKTKVASFLDRPSSEQPWPCKPVAVSGETPSVSSTLSSTETIAENTPLVMLPANFEMIASVLQLDDLSEIVRKQQHANVFSASSLQWASAQTSAEAAATYLPTLAQLELLRPSHLPNLRFDAQLNLFPRKLDCILRAIRKLRTHSALALGELVLNRAWKGPFSLQFLFEHITSPTSGVSVLSVCAHLGDGDYAAVVLLQRGLAPVLASLGQEVVGTFGDIVLHIFPEMTELLQKGCERIGHVQAVCGTSLDYVDLSSSTFERLLRCRYGMPPKAPKAPKAPIAVDSDATFCRFCPFFRF